MAYFSANFRLKIFLLKVLGYIWCMEFLFSNVFGVWDGKKVILGPTRAGINLSLISRTLKKVLEKCY